MYYPKKFLKYCVVNSTCGVELFEEVEGVVVVEVVFAGVVVVGVVVVGVVVVDEEFVEGRLTEEPI